MRHSIKLFLILILLAPLQAFALKYNTAGQHVGALLQDTGGNPITSGTTTVYVICDGVQTTGAGAAPISTGNGDWDYMPTQLETACHNDRFLFVNTSAVASEVEFDTVLVDTNGYPLTTVQYIDTHGVLWDSTNHFWKPQ